VARSLGFGNHGQQALVSDPTVRQVATWLWITCRTCHCWTTSVRTQGWVQPICRSGVWSLQISANVVRGRRWSTS